MHSGRFVVVFFLSSLLVFVVVVLFLVFLVVLLLLSLLLILMLVLFLFLMGGGGIGIIFFVWSFVAFRYVPVCSGSSGLFRSVRSLRSGVQFSVHF